MTEERRDQIIRLLEAMDNGLPMPVRREHSTSGFVNEARSRSCPDCLANGKVMKTCETCGGAGTVPPSHLDAVAVPDGLPDDGQLRDAYAVSETVQPYGVQSTTKLGHAPARDAAIDRMREQTREPFASFDDELAAANATPYVWERERAMLRARYDIDALAAALDALRTSPEPGLAAMIVAVYRAPARCQHAVEAPHFCRRCDRDIERVGLIEQSATLEAGIDRALRFISDRMPAVIRAPGNPAHPALSRQQRRSAA